MQTWFPERISAVEVLPRLWSKNEANIIRYEKEYLKMSDETLELLWSMLTNEQLLELRGKKVQWMIAQWHLLRLNCSSGV